MTDSNPIGETKMRRRRWVALLSDRLSSQAMSGGEPGERGLGSVASPREGVMMELSINCQIYTVAGEPDRMLLERRSSIPPRATEVAATFAKSPSGD